MLENEDLREQKEQVGTLGEQVQCVCVCVCLWVCGYDVCDVYMRLIVFQKQQLHLQQVDELTARIKTMEVHVCRILACVVWSYGGYKEK